MYLRIFALVLHFYPQPEESQMTVDLIANLAIVASVIAACFSVAGLLKGDLFGALLLITSAYGFVSLAEAICTV